MTRLRFLPRRPENQEVELLVLALLGLTGNAEVFRRGNVWMGAPYERDLVVG